MPEESDKEGPAVLYYLKRDLEESRVENRDLSFDYHMMKQQRNILVVLLIISLIISGYLYFTR